MTSEHAETEGHGSNGAALLSRDEAHARDRAAFLSGEVEEESEAEKPAAVASDEEPETEEAAAESTDETEEKASDETEDDAPDDDEEPAPKGLDQVRKTEQRMRARLDEQRKAFETERDTFVSEWKPRIEKVERLEQLIARAKNPFEIVNIAREAGMSEEDMATAGSVLFAHSSKGKADPKNAQVIAQSAREREQAERIAALEKRDREREAAAQKQAEEARAAENGRRLVENIVKAVKPEKSPLLAQALQNDREDAQQEIIQITLRLLDSTGTMPSVKAVHSEFERIEAKRLKRYGSAPAKPTNTNAPTKTATKTTATSKPTANENRTPSKQEIIAEMEELERAGRLS